MASVGLAITDVTTKVIFHVIGKTVKAVSFLPSVAPILLIAAVVRFLVGRSRRRRGTSPAGQVHPPLIGCSAFGPGAGSLRERQPADATAGLARSSSRIRDAHQPGMSHGPPAARLPASGLARTETSRRCLPPMQSTCGHGHRKRQRTPERAGTGAQFHGSGRAPSELLRSQEVPAESGSYVKLPPIWSVLGIRNPNRFRSISGARRLMAKDAAAPLLAPPAVTGPRS
jgi:hypothetical protein